MQSQSHDMLYFYSKTGCAMALFLCSIAGALATNLGMRETAAADAAIVDTAPTPASQEQPIPAEEAWEFSPYRVCIWFVLEPTLDTSADAQSAFKQRIVDKLDSTFGAAWRLTPRIAPNHLAAVIARDPAALAVDQLSANDLVLVLAKDDSTKKTLRVFDTSLEQLEKIAITRSDRAQLEIDSEPFATSQPNTVAPLLAKATDIYDSYEAIAEALRQQKVTAALIPRARLAAWSDIARQVTTILPWHTERTLQEFDKLFLVHVNRQGEEYRVTARELDCPMRLFGPVRSDSTVAWKSLASIATDAIAQSFAPVARIEEATGKSVVLRTRAGGLASDNSPARIESGDVLQPVIRREDRRGVATLLEPIPWTFIGVTHSDGIIIGGTVYSALGNVLQGKQTRRAQRVALRVRPTGDRSDIKVLVRTDLSQAQTGCQVYQRDLMTEELTLVGETDWRGIITIARPDALGSILPEDERLKRAEARRLAAEAALEIQASMDAKKAIAAKTAEEDRKKSSQGDVDADNRGDAPTAPSAGEVVGLPAGTPAEQPTPAAIEDLSELQQKSVKLRQPLMLFYVKSGDTVLARLPLVPGLHEVDIADLPSDARRLEAEAVLRGFQGEIIDLIGSRALASARVKQYLSERKYTEVDDIIGHVRRMSDYKSMADKLDGIQRRLLDESQEAVPMAAKSRIDRMTQTTRDMLQKYLENDLAAQLLRDLKQARDNAQADDQASLQSAKAAQAAIETQMKTDAAGGASAPATPGAAQPSSNGTPGATSPATPSTNLATPAVSS